MMFRDKLVEAVPVVQRYHGICRNGVIKNSVALKVYKNYEDSELTAPYVKEVQEYMNHNNQGIPARLLLVTDMESVAIKAAAYISEHFEGCKDDWYDELYDDYECEYVDYDEENVEPEKALRIVSMRQGARTERNTMINPYVMRLSEVGKEDMVLFTELFREEDMREKLEAIVSYPAMIQFIHIRRDQLQEAWVQELLIDYNADVLPLSELKLDYCEQVLQYLLKEEAYKLASSIESKVLVRKIIKRRGKHFREEDIAWYLDKAMECAQRKHPKSKVLTEADFKNLALGEKKPLEQLQELTGVNNVKTMAREMAALVREEMNNQKLGALHKSMLFLGNPGTGKTTCAKLLADIMADEGESNTSFVVATRKDLIGEYVGHTAPLVAQCFEDARGGVLFVDEAGFFLNRQAGEFVMEAIKEFVRYMELYPDVTVIFAMYPHEAKEFLELDAGLASRIGRFVNFEDYSNAELYEIATGMFEQRGYSMEAATKESIIEYLDALRKDKKKQFGNAREVRKLVESSIIAASLRKYQEKKGKNCITDQDILEGQRRLQQEALATRKVFGFGSKQVQ